MNIWDWIAPTPIEVNASQRGSGIAHNHAIRINHRYQFYYVVVKYGVILSIIQRQFAYNMTHYKTTVSLSSMEPCLNIYALPFSISESTISCFLFGESKLIDIETSNALSDNFLSVEQIIVNNLKVFPFFFIAVGTHQLILFFKLIFKFCFLCSKFFLTCFTNVYLLQIILSFFAATSLLIIFFKCLFFF